VENCARKRVGARVPGRAFCKASTIFDSTDEQKNWKVQISRRLNKQDEIMEMQKKKKG